MQQICYGLEANLTETRKRLSELKIQQERTRGKLEAQVRESGSIESRMVRGEEEIKELEVRLVACESERGTLRETVAPVNRANLYISIAAYRKESGT